ncbi:MAG: hypothetical protein QOC80_2833 [Frankiaceae bacterium]|nr:hypothetical protein [Frankiaceae bacterium]
MQMGFGLPVSGAWATADNIRTVATAAERLGYRTLWSFQRLTVPVDEAGAPQLPPAYGSVLDPLLPLAYAAAVTDRIGLGTAIVNMPYQPPAVLAKGLASLDVLSGGRLLAGLGIGWLPDEFTAAGVPFPRRGARAEDYLACLAALWADDPVAYEGEFYTVPRSSFLPKPVQPGGPPILLGGAAPKALARAGRLTSGWISASRADLTALGDSIEIVRQGARDAGRDESALRFVCRGVVRGGERTGPLTGTLDEVRADLPTLAAQGVTETFVDLNFDPAVGSPDVAPETAMRRAHEVHEAQAPGA